MPAWYEILWIWPGVYAHPFIIISITADVNAWCILWIIVGCNWIKFNVFLCYVVHLAIRPKHINGYKVWKSNIVMNAYEIASRILRNVINILPFLILFKSVMGYTCIKALWPLVIYQFCAYMGCITMKPKGNLVGGFCRIWRVYLSQHTPDRSCRPQMGPMLAPWTLLSGIMRCWIIVFAPALKRRESEVCGFCKYFHFRQCTCPVSYISSSNPQCVFINIITLSLHVTMSYIPTGPTQIDPLFMQKHSH